MIRVVMQGFPGCFHQEAAEQFFEDQEIEFVASKSFYALANVLRDDRNVNYGIMAIENNIAGTILQNYKILRDYRFRIVGEIYLPIHHNLIVHPGISIEEIEEVHSHPMALNQCLEFLEQYPFLQLVNQEDTALSVKNIADKKWKNIAAIGSSKAASLYNLSILNHNIETSKNNHTRFFILQNDSLSLPKGEFNKASVYIRTSNAKGSLLNVLQVVYDNNINLSKLQSYPIEGKINSYYFYLDLEFESVQDYEQTIKDLEPFTIELEVMGVYRSQHKYLPVRHKI